MVYSPEIKAYAKECYLVPGKDGNRKYSNRQITAKIDNDYGIKIHHSTISDWAKKGEWDKLWTDGVRAGFVDAVRKETEEERNKQRTQEEKIRQAISNSIKSRRIKIIQMLGKADRFYLSDEKKADLLEKGEYIPTNPTEAFNLWRYCMDELKDMEERSELKVNITGEVKQDVNLVITNNEFMEKELEFAEQLIKRRRGNVGGG